MVLLVALLLSGWAGGAEKPGKAKASGAAMPKPGKATSGAQKAAAGQPAGAAKAGPGEAAKAGAGVQPRVAWRPEYYRNRAYVPMEQVAAYYGLKEPKESGKLVILSDGEGKLRIEFTRGEKLVRIMGWAFYLSFPVVEVEGVVMVSVYDVRNVVDAILHPGERRDPAQLQTVVIDPAFGGLESGIRVAGLAEKDVVLDIGKRLAGKLEAAGFKVVMTRKDDSTVSLADREKVVSGVAGEAVFVSIRGNSGAAGVRGMETSTLPPAGTPATAEEDSDKVDRRFHAGNINDRESLALAAVLQSSVISTLKIPDLGIRRTRFAELRDINLPAAVVRVGYLSHKEEGARLATPEYRESLAENLLAGIRRYAQFLSYKLEERREEEKNRPLQFGEIRAEVTALDAGLAGERILLHVPVRAAPGVFVEREKVEVQLYLFERVDGEEIDLSAANPPRDEWLSVLPDWKATREEVLALTYLRPTFGQAEQKAYGKRTYFGYVARLVYDGRVVDEAASPANLKRCLFYFTAVFPRR
jgi:N-acetylmuramoyl-L-alanine amidase